MPRSTNPGCCGPVVDNEKLSYHLSGLSLFVNIYFDIRNTWCVVSFLMFHYRVNKAVFYKICEREKQN